MHSSRKYVPTLNRPQPPPMQERQPVFTQPWSVLLSPPDGPAPDGDEEKHVKSSADCGVEVSALTLATNVKDAPTGTASHRWLPSSETPTRWPRARPAPRRASRLTVLCCCLMSCLALVALASASCIVLAIVRNDEKTYALAWRVIGQFFIDAAGSRRRARQPRVEPVLESTTPVASLYALFQGIGNSSGYG